MKIRNGFVSNSSSSSFAILGYEVKPEKIDLSKPNGEKYAVDTGAEGEGGSVWMLDINQETIDYFVSEEPEKYLEGWTRFYAYFLEDGEVVTGLKLPETARIRVISETIEQMMPKDVAEFKGYFSW